MKYLISFIFLLLSMIFLSVTVYCGYKAFTEDITWGFVMLGLVLPTAVCMLITQGAFQSASEY